MENELITILINYGIAGVVIYMFYVLLSQKIEKLSDNISRLTEEIVRLREELKRINGPK